LDVIWPVKLNHVGTQNLPSFFNFVELPYSAKFWRGKTLANWMSFANILPKILAKIRSLHACTYVSRVTTHTINSPLRINIEQTIEISLGRCRTWPTMTLVPAWASFRHSYCWCRPGSCGLPGSLSQGSSSPSMAASQISLYSW